MFGSHRLFVIAAAMLFGACATAHAERDGLVAHYTFAEGQGDILRDHSGHGNDGKILGGPGWVKLPKGYALSFDGVDDYVDCGSAPSLNIAQQGTVEVWFKPSAYQGGLITRSTGNGWNDYRLTMAWYSAPSGSPGLLGLLSDGNMLFKRTLYVPKLEEWTHVALSWSLDDNRIRSYWNGRLVGSDPGFELDFGGAPLRLGIIEGLGATHYAGLIGEVRVYNRALSRAEIFGDLLSAAGGFGLNVQEGRKTIKLEVQTNIENKSALVTVDAEEMRPLRQGMRLVIEVGGTTMRTALPLQPQAWDYSTRLDLSKLDPGEYTLAAYIKEADGKVACPTATRPLIISRLAVIPDGRQNDGLKDTEALVLARDGQAEAVIAVPENADTWITTAAGWLAGYIKQATGADLKIVPESRALQGNVISVGHTDLLKEAGLSADGLEYDGCRMVVRGNTLYLYGRDEWSEEAGGPRGTCRAVTSFLENQLGVRWFAPGKDGEAITQRSRLAISRILDYKFSPAFAYASGRYPYGALTPASVANNFRTAIKLRTYGGHSYYDWLPEEVYSKEHPEYFALIDGKRATGGNHLCSSNPEVARILLEGIRKQFDAGYDWVQLGQEDGYVRCECEKCESLDDFRGSASLDNPCERVLLLHKWIVDECRKSHPNKTVHFLVYGPTVWPSRKYDKVGENVIAEMCNISPQVVDAWKGKVRGMTAYIYDFDTTTSKAMGIHLTPAEVASMVRYLHENRFVGIYHCVETNWGLKGPSIYALGKLMGNPYLDFRALQKDYCLGLFGPKAGPTMNQFFDVLYANPRVHDRIWPETVLRKLETLLAKAEAEAASDKEIMWVALTRDHFDYSCLLSRMLTDYRAYTANPSDAGWEKVRVRVNEFEDFRERILTYPDSRTDRYFPGYDGFSKFLAGKYVGYYQSWKAKRAEALEKGVRGTQVGWPSNSWITAPLTLDLSNPPHLRRDSSK